MRVYTGMLVRVCAYACNLRKSVSSLYKIHKVSAQFSGQLTNRSSGLGETRGWNQRTKTERQSDGESRHMGVQTVAGLTGCTLSLNCSEGMQLYYHRRLQFLRRLLYVLHRFRQMCQRCYLVLIVGFI